MTEDTNREVVNLAISILAAYQAIRDAAHKSTQLDVYASAARGIGVQQAGLSSQDFAERAEDEAKRCMAACRLVHRLEKRMGEIIKEEEEKDG